MPIKGPTAAIRRLQLDLANQDQTMTPAERQRACTARKKAKREAESDVSVH